MTQLQTQNGAGLAVHEANPMSLIAAMLEKGVAPSELTELFNLQERHEKNEAAREYARALADFQAKCPPVHKSRPVNAGPLKYQYAGYDDVMAVAGLVLKECGIALAFSTEAKDKGIRVTIRVRVGIHAEDYTLDVPVPEMRVNDTQRYGAALSYAKRYALCAALNIVVTDEDNDAQGLGETITEEQEIQLQEWIESKNVNPKRFLEWAGVEKLGDTPAGKYQAAIDYLKRK